MTKYIIDAHGLMVFLEKEPGFDVVQHAFLSAVEKNSNLLMTSVNYGEVYYIVLRECGKEKAAEITHIIDGLPIEVIDVDKTLAREAAHFKAYKKMSYADCFAAALAKRYKGAVLTGDKEFKEVEKEIDIVWLT